MQKKKLLKLAIQHNIEVAKWVKDVNEWANAQAGTEDEGGPGSNPPPPPPPPPTGFEGNP